VDVLRTPDERARHNRARQTYLRLEKLNQDVYDEKAEPRLASISKSMRTASRRGETAELKKLRDEQQKIVADRRKHAMDIVRADPRWQDAMRKRGVEDFELAMVDPWPASNTGPEDHPSKRRISRGHL